MHGYSGVKNNSYGKVCAVHSGVPGDLDGRMVYYKPVAGTLAQQFQFAFAMPMSNGRRGSQFVHYNIYQPSFAFADQGNLVANWIQLTNLESRVASGVLTFYDITGVPVQSDAISLAAGERRDFAGHQFGPNHVGYAAWYPDNEVDEFQMRNVRYLYDNAGFANSFDTAFQLEGTHGTGERIVAPFTTEHSEMSVLELSNVTTEPVSLQVDIYDDRTAFAEPLRQTIVLGAHQTQHIILNSLIGDGRIGTLAVDADKLGSIIGVVMQYRRSLSGEVEYMYGVQALQALGTVLRGSFNTYLSQTSTLVLINSGATAQQVSFQLMRSSGTPILPSSKSDFEVSVPAHGLLRFDLSEAVGSEDYGVVTVQSEDRNTLVGHVLRQRGLEYVMPTPLRQ